MYEDLENESRMIDVVVVGGGVAGIATALRLRQHNRSVTLIERSRCQRVRIGEILSPEIRKPLAKLRLWRELKTLQLRPISGVDVRWGSDQLRRHDHIMNSYQQAWVLPRNQFDKLLSDAAASRGVIIQTDCVVQRVTRVALGWHLQIGGIREVVPICCRFLVDATGRQNAFSKLIDRRALRFDRLVGVVGVLPVGSASNDDSLFVESVIDGWRYSVALERGSLACVYFTDADFVPSDRTIRAGWWRERVRNLISNPTNLALVENRHIYVRPAETMITRPIAGDGFLSVGDAASALDPLSGLGLIRALDGGIFAADAIQVTLEGTRSAVYDYAANVEQDFGRQLCMRARFYNGEGRWPKSRFWIRRQQIDLAILPVELDPSTNLHRSPGRSSAAIAENLMLQCEGNVLKVIWNCCKRPINTAVLASHVRRKLSDNVSDRDIIVGIQVMLAAGALTKFQ